MVALAALVVTSCRPSQPLDPKLSVVGSWQGVVGGPGSGDRSLMVFNGNHTFGFYQGTTMVGTWEQSGQNVVLHPTARANRWEVQSGATPGNNSINLVESDSGKTLSNLESGSAMLVRLGNTFK
jgi:hypothetical protein